MLAGHKHWWDLSSKPIRSVPALLTGKVEVDPLDQRLRPALRLIKLCHLQPLRSFDFGRQKKGRAGPRSKSKR